MADTLELLKKGNLIDRNGKYELIPNDYMYIGLYFSAHWCPPCRGFTPLLAKFYDDVRKNSGGKFQIVFLSSDRDEKQFDEYFAEMPWIALKYSDGDLKRKLSQMYDISGIPSLVILDTQGDLVIKDGRSIVANNNPDMTTWK